jgi:hypothetical protein
MLVFNSLYRLRLSPLGLTLWSPLFLYFTQPFLNAFSLPASTIYFLKYWLLRHFLHCRLADIADSHPWVRPAGATAASSADARISRSPSSAFIVWILRQNSSRAGVPRTLEKLFLPTDGPHRCFRLSVLGLDIGIFLLVDWLFLGREEELRRLSLFAVSTRAEA